MTSEPTVFVVDDDPAARDSVSALVRSMNGRCETFATGEEFLSAYDPSRTGCLVADLRLPGLSGLELQAELARRQWPLPMVLISGYVNVEKTVQAMKAGAEYVLRKPYRAQELWEAIQGALRIDQQWREQRARREELQQRFAALSPEEQDVLDLIADGLPNKVVARRLDVGLRTVEDRRRRIMNKVGVDSFAALVRLHGQLQSDSD